MEKPQLLDLCGKPPAYPCGRGRDWRLLVIGARCAEIGHRHSKLPPEECNTGTDRATNRERQLVQQSRSHCTEHARNG